MDRISDLPKIILHDILSRLPEEDAARTSVLSKAWKDTWSSFPILVFNEDKFELINHGQYGTSRLEMENLMRRRNNLLAFVMNTMLRFYDQL